MVVQGACAAVITGAFHFHVHASFAGVTGIPRARIQVVTGSGTADAMPGPVAFGSRAEISVITFAFMEFEHAYATGTAGVVGALVIVGADNGRADAFS